MPMHPEYKDVIDRTSVNLCSLLASLNEYPYFRFDSDQSITGQIAARTSPTSRSASATMPTSGIAAA